MVTKHGFFAKSSPGFKKWTFIFVHFLIYKKTFVDFITLFNIINWIFNLKKNIQLFIKTLKNFIELYEKM
jgi:hypothetical protein